LQYPSESHAPQEASDTNKRLHDIFQKYLSAGCPEVKLPIPTNPQLFERVNSCWIHKSKSRGGRPGFRLLVPGSWVGIFFAPFHMDVHRPACTALRGEPLAHLFGGDVATGQNCGDQLALESLTIGVQRREAGGTGGFEHHA
jgi:hypothetical protein